MRRSLRAIVIATPLVAAFAWFVPSGAEQPEPTPGATAPASAAAATPLPPPPPRGPEATAGFPDLRTSRRIAEYLERAPEPDAQARNPFRYAARVAPPAATTARRAARSTRVADGEGAAGAATDLFPLTLIGLAEMAGESPHRVAILSSPAALFHAVAGETLLGRFRLGEVTASGVVVTDTVTGRDHVLALR